MKIFSRRLFIFSIPLQIILWPILLSGVIWPIEKFSARALEVVNLIGGSSPFIPNTELLIDEYPDKMFYQPGAVIKRNKWVTDEFGYRNYKRTIPKNGYDIVVTGSSNVYGSYYDQDDLISEELIRLCGCSVYNMGSNKGSRHLKMYQMFRDNPPRVFVIVVREKEFSSNKWNIKYDPEQNQFLDLPPNPQSINDWQILFSNLKKMPLFHFIRSKLGTGKIRHVQTTNSKTTLLKALTIFSQFEKVVNKNNTKLLIYIHPTEPETDLFLKSLQKEKIPIIGVPFIKGDSTLISGENNYWLEQDSHWKKSSIKFVSRMIVENLQKRDFFFSEKKINQRLLSDEFQNWRKAPIFSATIQYPKY